MYLYSGNCRLGTVGAETKFCDTTGAPLRVGDIVVIWTEHIYVDHLTAVVSDEFTSYSDGTHKIKDGPIRPFVMGIASVDLEHPNEWNVRKVKDHNDVVDGEHWQSYGFRYSAT